VNLTPQTVAFLDIDTQFDFMVRGGRLYAEGAETIIPNLRKLVRFAQQRCIPLISSVDAHAPDDPEFKTWPPHAVVGTRGQKKLPETLLGNEVYVPNSAAAVLPDMRRFHVVLEKQDFPIFTNPAAEQAIRESGATTFVVFGVVTEVCVKHAVLGLLTRGFEVVIVSDAVWPIAEQTGDTALAEMKMQGATLATTDYIVAELSQLSSSSA